MPLSNCSCNQKLCQTLSYSYHNVVAQNGEMLTVWVFTSNWRNDRSYLSWVATNYGLGSCQFSLEWLNSFEEVHTLWWTWWYHSRVLHGKISTQIPICIQQTPLGCIQGLVRISFLVQMTIKASSNDHPEMLSDTDKTLMLQEMHELCI